MILSAFIILLSLSSYSADSTGPLESKNVFYLDDKLSDMPALVEAKVPPGTSINSIEMTESRVEREEKWDQEISEYKENVKTFTQQEVVAKIENYEAILKTYKKQDLEELNKKKEKLKIKVRNSKSDTVLIAEFYNIVREIRMIEKGLYSLPKKLDILRALKQ